MPANMMESDTVAEEWPGLTNHTSEIRPASGCTVEGEDWELLAAEEQAINNTSFEKDMVLVDTNPKMLKHCASSPDLRRFHGLRSVVEEDEEAWTSRDDSSSYAFVSGPGSVTSTASNFSFKDAILQAPQGTPQQLREPAASSSAPRLQRSKPKIVVTPIRRCSKSTGDLQALVIYEEDEEEVLGDTDAMDYYHRKALGAKGRVSGLRMRPDEAKRKQITLYKKQLQREANTTRN